MSSASDINSFVDEMKAQDKISVLVNNAGCMVNERRFTDDGHELNYATNILGTVQLTEGLIPLMEENGRVVRLTSLHDFIMILILFFFYSADYCLLWGNAPSEVK